MNCKKKNTSFTLIELLVVIVIIGILAGVIMISTSSSISKANFARAKAFSSNIQNSMLLNLVAQYELNGNTIDSWGKHDGTGSNITYTTGHDGKENGAAMFDGSASIRIPYNSDFSLGSKMSAFIWVRGGAQVAGWFFCQYECSSQRSWGLLANNSKLGLFLSDDGTASAEHLKSFTTKRDVFDNTWHFVGFVWNSGALKLYVDGLVDRNYSSIPISFLYNSSADLTIGSRLYNNEANYLFIGQLDDAKIYNTSLSSSQIKQNYIAGLDSMLVNGSISKAEYNQRIELLGFNSYCNKKEY